MTESSLRIEPEQTALAAFDLAYGSRLLYPECIEPALAVLLSEFGPTQFASIRGLLGEIRQVEFHTPPDERKWLPRDDLFAEKIALQMILDQVMGRSQDHKKWYSLGISAAECELALRGKHYSDGQPWTGLTQACQQLSTGDQQLVLPCRRWLECNSAADPENILSEIASALVAQEPFQRLAKIPWNNNSELFAACIRECLRVLSSAQAKQQAPAEKRDRRAYEMRWAGHSYKMIMVALNKDADAESWKRLKTANGVKAAITRYAAANGLALPKKGKPGRPSRKQM